MLAGALGKGYGKGIENIGLERDVGLDVPVFPVVQEDGNPVAIAGNILEKRVLHKRIDTGPPDEIPYKIILELEKGEGFKFKALVHQEIADLFQENLPAVLLDLF